MEPMKTDAPFASCPDFEVLSAWYDSELRDEALEQHIRSCDLCARLVASFTAIDHQCHAPVILDAQGLGRIKSATREKIADEPRWRALVTPMRLAAAAAIFGGVFAFRAYQTYHSDSTEPFLTLAPAGEGEPTERLAQLTTPTPLEQSGRTVELVQATQAAAAMQQSQSVEPTPIDRGPETMVAISNCGPRKDAPTPIEPMKTFKKPAPVVPTPLTYTAAQMVGYTKGSPSFAAPGSSTMVSSAVIQPRTMAVELSDHVRHVWFVEEVEEPVAELQGLLPDKSDDIDAMLKADSSGIALDLVVEDRNLAKLVDHFHARGFDLVSAEAPQPDASDSILFTGKKIRYHIEIVEK